MDALHTGAASLLSALPASLAPSALFTSPSASTFVLSRTLFLHWLGGVYVVAWVIALRQNKALLGSRGLLPVDDFLAKRAPLEGFWKRPTLFWAAHKSGAPQLDLALDAHALAGLVLAAPICATGRATAPQLFALWALYTSIVNVGQRWYAFGWESLLLETGFLAIFLAPLGWGAPALLAPPAVCVWAFRWLLCRNMLGAGLIKLRGDSCWRDGTAMESFYETQPIPNPLSRALHRMPRRWHVFETYAGLWLVEILAPLLLLLPGSAASASGTVRQAAACVQLVFQLVLISAGNLSFLNWLTAAPALFCLGDGALARLFPLRAAAAASAAADGARVGWMGPPMQLLLAALLGRLSLPVVRNLLALDGRQQMNAVFGPWRLVNTYGAFGSVSKTRYEVLLQGTRDELPTADAEWREYDFVAKPGAPERRPPLLSPYHLRLDWLLWFLPFSGWRTHPWLAHLTAKLLSNDATASSLLRENPFDGGTPPRWVRAELYEYRFASKEEAARGLHWSRRREREYMPPLSLEKLKPFLEGNGWWTEEFARVAKRRAEHAESRDTESS